MVKVNFAMREEGQMLVMLAFVLPLLVLFSGLAIDGGILYITKARLSKSVDAACLDTMLNLGLGQSAASAIGTNIFNANFGNDPPVPTITYPLDKNGNQMVQVNATANVQTLFMKYIPTLSTVPVSAMAQATRGKLVMSLILDRSGSMKLDQGNVALQSAVPTFVGHFSDTLDEVAMVSFASYSSVDVPMGYNFTTPITNAVKAMNFSGATFGTGAGTKPILDNSHGAPFSLGKLQNDSVLIPPGQNVAKVIVYFTDGLMNTVQDQFACWQSGVKHTPIINFGGCDAGTCSPDDTVAILDYTNGNQWGWFTYSGGSSGFPFDSNPTDICKDNNGNNVITFPSQTGAGVQKTMTRQNVTAEAQYRAIQTAIALRSETPIPTVIFTIGLGNGVDGNTQAFLAQLANDPNYPTYISSQPAGAFFYVPNCPSSTCTNDLQQVFNEIAAKVLLRLTG